MKNRILGSPVFSLDASVFTYILWKEPVDGFSKHHSFANDLIVISHSSNTVVHSAVKDGRELAVIGYCIDSHGEIDRADIPAFLLEQSFSDATAAYRACDRFAGRFVIAYADQQHLFVWGDATGSVQINYSIGDNSFCMASTDRLVAKILGLELSAYSQKIRNGSNINSQPLPYNITMYDGVKLLLPNHILDCTEKKMFRVKLQVEKTHSSKEVDDIIYNTLHQAKKILRKYQEDYSFVHALTAGTDSRVIFALLKEQDSKLRCYTFRHSFQEMDDELHVPSQLCKIADHVHMIVNDMEASETYVHNVLEYGSPGTDRTTINLAYTLLANFQDSAIMPGDIIDEIGKSTQEGNIPNCLLNSSFFLCKLHNFERATQKELKRYLRDIYAAGEANQIADIFAMEMKVGRRVSQTNAIYSLCGISILNCFNCRELLLEWMRIPRSVRIKKVIHTGYLQETDPELLKVPFNPDTKLHSIIKKNWVFLYIATYVKYFLQKYFKLTL